MPQPPPINNAKDVAEAQQRLKEMAADDSGGKKIIGKDDVRPIPTVNERKRLNFESTLFWDVYFKRKGTRDERAKRAASTDSKKKSSVAGDAAKTAKLSTVDQKRVVKEATIFWEVYYKVKKKLDPPKDTKGKTKVTPAKKAVEGVKKVGLDKVPKKKGWFSSLIDMILPFVTSAIIAITPLILKFAAIVAAIAAAILAIKNIVPKIGEMNQAFKDLRKGAKETDEAFRKLAKKYDDRAGEAKEDPDRKREATALKLQKQIDLIRQEGFKKGRDETMPGWGKTIGLYFGTLFRGYSKTKDEYLAEKDAQRDAIIRKYKDEAEAKAKPLLDMLDKIGGGAPQPGEKGFGVAMGDKATPEQIAKWQKIEAEKLEKSRAEYFKKMEALAYLTKQTFTPEQQQKAWEAEIKRLQKDKEQALAEADTLISSLEKSAKKKEETKKKTSRGRRRGRGSSAYGSYGNNPMQDFVSRPGMPAIPFSSQDDILGFKQGGPVSDLLGSGADIGKFQLSEIRISNMHLKTLVDLTRGLLAKDTAGGGNTVMNAPPQPLPHDNSIQGDMSGPTYSSTSSDWYNSEYNMHTPGILA